MRRILLALLVFVLGLSFAPTQAARPGRGAISLSRPTVKWSGGPMNSMTEVLPELVPELCTEASCDDFQLTISVPAAHWKRAFGGVAIQANWDDVVDDFDLFVYNSAGEQVAESRRGNTTSEAAFLFAPTPGTYTVRMVGFTVSDARYRARASVVQERGSKA